MKRSDGKIIEGYWKREEVFQTPIDDLSQQHQQEAQQVITDNKA